MVKNLKQFVFNALLAEDTLSSLNDIGIDVKNLSGVKETMRVVEKDFSPVIWYNANKMSSVYTAIYCIENTLRNFIQERLLERKGIDWWETSIPANVKRAVQKLKDDEVKNKYHAIRGDSLINYTMLGNLADIITNNWDDFSDIIPNQAWINSRVTDLEKSRNIIMHTGVLDEYEIERIEMIVRDLLRQIG